MDKPIEMANRFAVMSAKMKIRTYLAPVSTIDSKLDTVLKLFNDAWENNWGFVPMTREELAHMAKDLKPLLTDECLSIVEVDGVPAAFALALPNLTEVSADLDGQLLPFGWARLGWRVKRRAYTSGRLLLMGVSRQYRETGLGAGLALLAIEKMREGVIRLGIRTAELGWVLEDNRPLLRMLDLLNVRRYKTHRVYQKSLVETPANVDVKSHHNRVGQRKNDNKRKRQQCDCGQDRRGHRSRGYGGRGQTGPGGLSGGPGDRIHRHGDDSSGA